MIDIMLCGCHGKMGKTVERIVKADPTVQIVAGVDIENELSADYPVFLQPHLFNGHADVIIDFSHPAALVPLLEYAVKTKTPIVIATTGISADEQRVIEKAALSIPIFFSFNMSLGVNLMVGLAKKAAALLSDGFDIEIIEKHHNQKIDAPSGTAIMLANGINSALGNSGRYTYDRHSVRRKRDKNEIGISSVRGGTIVGEHTVIFAGDDEVLEITHSAHSKAIFAVGAVKAAKWLINKSSALYDMTSLVLEQKD